MHDPRQLSEVFRLAGEFEDIDPTDAVPLLQSPAHAAVAGEGVVTEILADEESPAAVFAFGHLKHDSGTVGVIALEAPILRRRQNAQGGRVSVFCSHAFRFWRIF
ncbi:MAG: hypothetical protein ABS95_02185 [Verrucomicrobia bacterium SCN 57-15]|nr:MAG: hypothetical protein ABS95_02185 [Verrucomicrobia bacterium SCN 57-15]